MANDAGGQTGGPMLGRAELAAIRPVLETAGRRCELLSAEAGIREIPVQLAIRAVVLTKPSMTAEIWAFRKLCSVLLAARQSAWSSGLHVDPVDTFPKLLNAPQWMELASWSDIHGLQGFLNENNRTGMIGYGRRLLPELIARLGAAGDLSCQTERALRLTGVSMSRAEGNAQLPPKGSWQPVTEQMMQELEARLAQMSASSGGGSPAAGFSNRPDLYRMMARAAWLTGMRSVELFSFRLDRIPHEAAAPSGATEPVAAGRGAGRPDQQAPAKPAVTLAAAMPHSGDALAADVPASSLLLHIRSAKTRCASPRLRNSARVQILQGIGAGDLECLDRVSRLRLLGFDRKRIQNITRYCSRSLKRTSMELFPGRSDPITLHTLRHAFVDQARLTMRPAEIAALTGHTSVGTVTGYGGRYRQFRPGRRASRWMPVPDPQRVAEIVRVWAAGNHAPAIEAEPDVYPEPDDLGERRFPGPDC